MKLFGILGLLLCTVTLNVFASTDSNFEKFMSSNNSSDLEIQYNDLDQFLELSVLVLGPSNREKAPRVSAKTGTRLKGRTNRLTGLEGNRFYFDNFDNDEYVEILRGLKESLEALPSEVALSEFNSKEQLAYWLNLYNFTFLHELAVNHPDYKLNKIMKDEQDADFLNKKVLVVSDTSLSLNDIKYNIVLPKYKSDPLTAYGFISGVIGAPSIQSEAFTGKTVFKQLKEIAFDFVNSNRGTYYGGRISVFYKNHLAFFDNDPSVVKDHVLDYLQDEVYSEIANMPADQLDMGISDWNDASLGEKRAYGAGISYNNAAFLDSASVSQRSGNEGSGGSMSVQNFVAEGLVSKSRLNIRFSAEELELLQAMGKRHEVRNGVIELKELSEEEVKALEDEKRLKKEPLN
ncbi:DUF547 domain-containing protein [Alteromonas sp. 1_MG-2023]|uniref:DUF547 domain-containing protein n=1 Tax=Alteromonas sp. 1_MG-2023 TaxID=3062669 RepID=UPI0026E305C1|nr:DUF547 domain-containing protein [Alteromonas sp. 1_MG-2023]MDO6568807.1 DUF547 domain-containing protein [Alteromonas sp. 1_MG-2023]